MISLSLPAPEVEAALATLQATLVDFLKDRMLAIFTGKCSKNSPQKLEFVSDVIVVMIAVELP